MRADEFSENLSPNGAIALNKRRPPCFDIIHRVAPALLPPNNVGRRCTYIGQPRFRWQSKRTYGPPFQRDLILRICLSCSAQRIAHQFIGSLLVGTDGAPPRGDFPAAAFGCSANTWVDDTAETIGWVDDSHAATRTSDDLREIERSHGAHDLRALHTALREWDAMPRAIRQSAKGKQRAVVARLGTHRTVSNAPRAQQRRRKTQRVEKTRLKIGTPLA